MMIVMQLPRGTGKAARFVEFCDMAAARLRVEQEVVELRLIQEAGRPHRLYDADVDEITNDRGETYWICRRGSIFACGDCAAEACEKFDELWSEGLA